MADKQIGSLPQAQTVDDDSLFVCEQQGVAMKTTGAQWKGFAVKAVSRYVAPAQQAAAQAAQSATNAAKSEQNAAQSAEEAADSADKAEQYSGKPPIIQNDTWWTWDAETGQYVDTGESARGDVMFATFAIDPETGILTMTTPDGYSGPVFSLVNGFLEVSINA
jgi:hypothetical protein